jgi:hypothetical protein
MNQFTIYVRDTVTPDIQQFGDVLIASANDFKTGVLMVEAPIIKPPKICITDTVIHTHDLELIAAELRLHLSGSWSKDMANDDRQANRRALMNRHTVYDLRQVDGEYLWFISHIDYETVVCKRDEL